MRQVALNDEQHFQLISGLWKGERLPLRPAKVLRATNFGGDGLIDFDDIVELDVEARHFEERQLRAGDIVIERSGGGPKQPVGRVALFTQPDELPYFSSNFTTALRVRDREVFDPQYVALYLHALYLDGVTETLQRATTGIRNLDWSEYLRLLVPVRPLTEQREIVHVLGGVRRAFRQERELVRTLEELKRASTSRAFAQGLRNERLKETEVGLAPESWLVRRLDTIARVISTRMSYSELETAKPHGEGGERVLGIKVSDMNRPGNRAVLASAALEKMLDAGLARTRCAPPGTIVFPKRGAAIATNKKRLSRTWTVFDPNVIGVVPGELVDSDFLFQWFQAFDLRLITEPGPTPQINKKHLDPLLIPAPADIEEQRAISSLLNSIDRKLDAHREKLAALQDLMNSLLHRLATGELDVSGILDTSPLDPETR